jgi:hypothetical protein
MLCRFIDGPYGPEILCKAGPGGAPQQRPLINFRGEQ